MPQRIRHYLQSLERELQTGRAREHAYRTPLKTLLESLSPGVNAVNEPKHIVDAGAPDFIVLRGADVPIGYLETKDLDVDLQREERSEQMTRYRDALNNLILTNYLDFRWYVEGELRLEASLGRLARDGRTIRRDPASIQAVLALLQQFFAQQPEAIGRADELARRMAHLARLLRQAIEKTFEQEDDQGPFHAQLQAFQNTLVLDLDRSQFADMYAQTLTYGLFAARVQTPANARFDRDSAARYLPHTNPFLRDFFYLVSGPYLPDTVSWLVDDLAHLLDRADMAEILRDFGRRTRQEDPVIHFYETFLREYDPALREQRGVYFTPESVVSFIVRAIDDILQTHFGRPDGLADANTLILDPAAGTGTFLYFVIQHIYDHLQATGQGGTWNAYVRQRLLPRLFGFELLMAAYAMAHLKLDLQLKELGYDFHGQERLKIYLTNTLDQPLSRHGDPGFAGFLSQEGNQALEVKQDNRIEVILGNPPYSGESMNKGIWIRQLVRDYLFIDGERFNERNPKWLQNDYVKFIRWAQWRIERTGRGVLGFVTDHGYLNNPTFRGMRWHLLQSFSDIYILNLHGSAKKRETAPDGSKDENVFDIQQGVAIGLFIKEAGRTGPAQVHHADLWGLRQSKYEWLFNNDLAAVAWQTLTPQAPFYLFVPQNVELREEYQAGWKVTEIFPINSVGIVTARDHLTIHWTPDDVWQTVQEFARLPSEEARTRFDLGNDARDWKVHLAQEDIRKSGPSRSRIQPILYRPFDTRFTYYTGKTRGFICMPRPEVMFHMMAGNTIALHLCRQIVSDSWQHVLATDQLTDDCYVSLKTRERGYTLPLYTFEEEAPTLFSAHGAVRKPNLNRTFIQELKVKLGLRFRAPDTLEIQPASAADSDAFTPEDVFYCAYAIFHSPTYRTRYAEFLKIDFPRLPLTSDVALFRALAHLGNELVDLHLLRSPHLQHLITRFPQAGRNEVQRVRYVEPHTDAQGQPVPGRVYLNDSQYFEGIEPAVWEFQIGGYQVLEKWLKDRKGRLLSYEDLRHYQRVVVALHETIRLMDEIDATIPGWPIT